MMRLRLQVVPPAERQQPALHLLEDLVDVGDRDRRRHDLLVVLGEHEPALVEDQAVVDRHVGEVVVVVGREAPVLRPGGVVDLLELLRGPCRAARTTSCGSLMPCRSCDALGELRQDLGASACRGRRVAGPSGTRPSPSPDRPPRPAPGSSGGCQGWRIIGSSSKPSISTPHSSLMIRSNGPIMRSRLCALSQSAAASSSASRPPGRPRTRGTRRSPSGCRGSSLKFLSYWALIRPTTRPSRRARKNSPSPCLKNGLSRRFRYA